MAIQPTQQFIINIVLVFFAVLALGLGIWALVTPKKCEKFGDGSLFIM
jgi:hypothetical protein